MSDSLLPPSATNQERALDLSTARVGTVPVPLRTLWDADTCPANLLPWLAWALSVDLWDDTWTTSQKRQAIKDAVAYHRIKGTAGAVRTAVAAHGATITEWFEDGPPGEPYTFVIDMGTSGDDAAAVAGAIRAANKTKNARSHYTFRLASEGEFYIGAVCVLGDIVSITG